MAHTKVPAEHVGVGWEAEQVLEVHDVVVDSDVGAKYLIILSVPNLSKNNYTFCSVSVQVVYKSLIHKTVISFWSKWNGPSYF